MNGAAVLIGHDQRRYAQSWALSLSVHAAILTLALLFLAELKPVPAPEPFRWNVAMVDAPRRDTAQAAAADTTSAVKPSPTRHAVAAKRTPAPTPSSAIPPVPTPTVEPQQPPPVPTARREVPREIARVPEPEQAPLPKFEEIPPTPKPAPVPEHAPSPAFEPIPPSPPAPAQTAKPFPKPAPAPEQTPFPKFDAIPPTPKPEPTPAPQVAQATAQPPPEQPTRHSETPPAAPEAAAPPAAASAAPAPAPAPRGPAEQQLASAAPPHINGSAKPDYGWLTQMLWRRIEQLKRYPAGARLNRWEGTVVVKAIVRDDGELMDLRMEKSSGYAVLDDDAMELLRRASPLKLRQELGRSQLTIRIPITYKLE